MVSSMLPPSVLPLPYNELLTLAEVDALLASDGVAQRVREKGRAPHKGDLVGVRLNLNLLKNTGKAIQTLHEATNKRGYMKNQGFYGGEAIDYAQVVVLKNAYFNVNQAGREAIAKGEVHKFPMASVDGELVSQAAPPDFKGMEIRFNPRAHHLFVDSNDHAVHSAEEVVIVGHRIYARGRISYHTELSAPSKAGDTPSATLLKGKEALLEQNPPVAASPPPRRGFGVAR